MFQSILFYFFMILYVKMRFFVHFQLFSVVFCIIRFLRCLHIFKLILLMLRFYRFVHVNLSFVFVLNVFLFHLQLCLVTDAGCSIQMFFSTGFSFHFLFFLFYLFSFQLENSIDFLDDVRFYFCSLFLQCFDSTANEW